jgi:hypothetical protein
MPTKNNKKIILLEESYRDAPALATQSVPLQHYGHLYPTRTLLRPSVDGRGFEGFEFTKPG